MSEETRPQESLSQDELRRRRLARFGASSNPSPTPSNPPNSIPIPQKPLSTSEPIPSANDKSNLSSTPPKAMFSSTPPKSSINPFAPLEASKSTDTHEEWEDSIIKSSLGVSLVNEKKPSVVYLSGLSQDLTSTLLSTQDLDRILIEVLSTEKIIDQNPIQYLINSYKKVAHASSTTKTPKRLEIIKVIQQHIVSYIGLQLLYPNSFLQPIDVNVGVKDVLTLLEEDLSTTNSLPELFLDQFLTAFTEPSLTSLFSLLFEELSYRMKSLSLVGAFIRPLRVMTLLSSKKHLSSILIKLPSFIPQPPAVATSTLPARAPLTGRELETNSILGSFFRLTSCPSDRKISSFYFAVPSSLTSANIQTSFKSIREDLLTSQRQGLTLIKSLLKSSPESKRKVLEWLIVTLNCNLDRCKMNPDRRKVSTDGFMMNIGYLFIGLSFPFVDARSKFNYDSLDLDYLLHPEFSPLTGIADEPRNAFGSSTEEISNMMEKLRKRSTHQENIVSGKKNFNFITESFFLTLRAFYLGVLPTFAYYSQLSRIFRERKTSYDLLSQMNLRNPNSEDLLLLNELKAQMDEIDRDRLCFESQIFEPTFISRSVQFLLFTSSWLLRTINPTAISANNTSNSDENQNKILQTSWLPLPENPSLEWSALPEWITETVLDFFIYVLKFIPEQLETTPNLHELLVLLIVLLDSPTTFLRNPYLKSKIVEILDLFTPAAHPTNSPKNFDYLFDERINEIPIQQDLCPALAKFYTEIEFQGSGANRFYDKYTIRFYIANIFKYLWNFNGHKKYIKNFLTKFSDKFLRFVNMIINDAIYLIDESTGKISELRSIELAMEDSTKWNEQERDVRQEKEEQYRRLERTVKSYLLLSMETIGMLRYLTDEITSPFLRSELVERIAVMLNDILNKLVGKKSVDLKVKNPEKLNWKPKELLNEVIGIYLNLNRDNNDVWSMAIVKDERSFTSEEMFLTAKEVLKNDLSPAKIVELNKLIETLKDVKRKVADWDVVLGDIPDEFLDPVMQTLMTNPVVLPSGTVMDMSVIGRHLLSSNVDPFTRQPLSLEMLKPAVDVKKKIVDWLQGKGLSLEEIAAKVGEL